MKKTILEKDQAADLQDTVVKQGYCIGCGVCASVLNTPFKMMLNDYGMLQADRISVQSQLEEPQNLSAICPFSNNSLNEDELAAPLFGVDCQYHQYLGYHRSQYAGYVVEGDYRENGSSGGFGSWVQCELLENELVDAVINVRSFKKNALDSRLFKYSIARTIWDVQAGAQSRYYPVELSEVLNEVRTIPGRYALVGLPCFIKAVRLLCRKDPVLAERIVFYIGLVCGHLKSTRFSESFAWQMGIHPSELEKFEFRVKQEGKSANQYAVAASNQIKTVKKSTNELLGSDWGLGFFKYQACDFCDDVFAETADVVVGDAWLPDFVSDSAGTNILIVRNPVIDAILEKAVQREKIHLQSMDADTIAKSQAGGLRHRRDSLPYRLYVAYQAGKLVLRKRVKPTAFLFPAYERKRQEMRMKIQEMSHYFFDQSLKANHLKIYLDSMAAVIDPYKKLTPTIMDRVINKLRRTLNGNYYI